MRKTRLCSNLMWCVLAKGSDLSMALVGLLSLLGTTLYCFSIRTCPCLAL